MVLKPINKYLSIYPFKYLSIDYSNKNLDYYHLDYY